MFVAIGTELVLFTIVGGFGGSWLDERWATSPWLMVAGLVMGAAAGFVHLFRAARRFF